MQVEFEEQKDPTLNRKVDKKPSTLASLLMKTKIVKTENQANIVLILFALILFAFSLVMFATGEDKRQENYRNQLENTGDSSAEPNV